MADIQVGWSNSTGSGDWIFQPSWPGLWVDQAGTPIIDQSGVPIDAVVDQSGAFQWINDLVTAVLISLFTDAAADASDVIPDSTTDRRGWWGGTIGSKLWLRQRMKRTDAALALVKSDINDALAWLIADEVASAVEVTTWFPGPRALAAKIVITRGDGALSLQFADLWDSL